MAVSYFIRKQSSDVQLDGLLKQRAVQLVQMFNRFVSILAAKRGVIIPDLPQISTGRAKGTKDRPSGNPLGFKVALDKAVKADATKEARKAAGDRLWIPECADRKQALQCMLGAVVKMAERPAKGLTKGAREVMNRLWLEGKPSAPVFSTRLARLADEFFAVLDSEGVVFPVIQFDPYDKANTGGNGRAYTLSKDGQSFTITLRKSQVEAFKAMIEKDGYVLTVRTDTSEVDAASISEMLKANPPSDESESESEGEGEGDAASVGVSA